MTEPARLRRASRTLPALVDQDGAAWLTADSAWIAVYGGQADSPEPALYCLDCRAAPSAWHPEGQGWQAFDPVVAKAEAAAKARKPAAKPRAAPRDPMELVY